MASGAEMSLLSSLDAHDLAAVVDPWRVGAHGPGHVDRGNRPSWSSRKPRGRRRPCRCRSPTIWLRSLMPNGPMPERWGPCHAGVGSPRACSGRGPAGTQGRAAGAVPGPGRRRPGRRGGWSPIGAGGEAAAVAAARAVATAAPATRTPRRRRRLVVQVDAMLVSSRARGAPVVSPSGPSAVRWRTAGWARGWGCCRRR